jgi:hypothetical protein
MFMPVLSPAPQLNKYKANQTDGSELRPRRDFRFIQNANVKGKVPEAGAKRQRFPWFGSGLRAI